MILRLFVLLVITIVAVLAYDSSERQNSGLPLVHADYQRCMMVKNGPIVRPRGVRLYPRNSETV